MPKMPEPTPPPPAPILSGQPTTVKPLTSRRGAMRQATRGPAGLTIPRPDVSSGTSLTNLSIGPRQ